ncbi:MAG: MFS transporter [Bryobacteraceae bacterium]
MSTALAQARENSNAGRAQWVALSLLVVSICINYMDRGNLSVAAHQVSVELHLDAVYTGLLLSAFFWSYASFQVVSGWLIDRYNVNWVYAAGFLLWSAATAMTGLTRTFVELFALRLLLGMSESVAYPSYSKIIASGFPEKQRGLANSLIDAGSKIGPAVGMIAGGLILASFGWRTMFVSIGGISLLWLIPWVWVIRKPAVAAPIEALEPGRLEPTVAPNGPAPGYLPGFRDILLQREAWGTFIGLFAGNYAWYFLLTWLPSYLIMERHYTTRMMAVYGSLPFWGVALSAVVSGWLSDRWIARGGSPTRVRKTFAVAGLTLGTLMLPAAMVKNPVGSMALLMSAWLAYGLFSSNIWAITQTLAGPLAAGKWTGLQNGIGNLAGVVAPVVTGLIVQQTGKFFYAFVAVCAVLLVGAASYLFVVRRVEPVEWGVGPLN